MTGGAPIAVVGSKDRGWSRSVRSLAPATMATGRVRITGMQLHDLSADGDVLERVSRCARRALGAYGCHPDTTVRLLNVSENATYLVQDPSAGPSVLRVHRLGYHTEPAIASELAWMDALRAEAGVRTPRVLNATDGRRVVTAADEASGERRHCVRFEFLPGTEPADDPEHFAELGEITPACTSTPGDGPARPGSPGFTGTTTRRSARRRGGDTGRTGSASARPSARCWGGSTPPCVPGWPRTGPVNSATASSTPTPGWPTCSWTTAGSASSTSTTPGSAGTCTTPAPR